jgi:hypothetical protein
VIRDAFEPALNTFQDVARSGRMRFARLETATEQAPSAPPSVRPTTRAYQQARARGFWRVTGALPTGDEVPRNGVFELHGSRTHLESASTA